MCTKISFGSEETEMIKHGFAPFLECSTKGDRRFSAFCAHIRSRNNQSIEEIYQAAKIFDDWIN